MTADEWDSNDSLIGALYALDLDTSQRKLQLFLVAGLRAPPSPIQDEIAKALVDCLEWHAEDRETAALPLRKAIRNLEYWKQGTSPHHVFECAALACEATWRDGAKDFTATAQMMVDRRVQSRGIFYGQPLEPEFRQVEQLELLSIVRDIFGNPFRPVGFDPAWRTEPTVGIAARMYDDRDFAAMPILADALEEAGCDNADTLTHCREPGVHVRGCWVVDLVLGKC